VLQHLVYVDHRGFLEFASLDASLAGTTDIVLYKNVMNFGCSSSGDSIIKLRLKQQVLLSLIHVSSMPSSDAISTI